jgi:diguanylate cyclase (GGDEF)-like protein
VSYAVLALLLASGEAVSRQPTLVWLPSGVAIVALLVTPGHRWLEIIGGLFAGQMASAWLIGAPLLVSFAFSVAHCAEALICASVGIRLFTRQHVSRYASLGSLFVVALLGGSLSAVMTQPFRMTPDEMHFVHWLLGHALGIISVTPILLFLHDRQFPAAEGRRLEMMVSRKGLPLATLCLFGLTLAVLYWFPGPMLLLVGLAIVVTVIRYGQLAASTGVLTYAAAAMIARDGGAVSPGLAGIAPDTATLIIQISMLLILATSLPLATLLQTSDHLQARLKEQNGELEESLQVLTMAEELVGMGRWRLDLPTGRQHWSPAMLEMNGLDPGIGPDPGDVTALLPDGGRSLFGRLAEKRDARQPYNIEYTIVPHSGLERFLRMVVSNEFDENGKRVAVFGVALDVTEQVYRERALTVARQRALDLAAEARVLALTDSLTGLANRRCVFERLDHFARVSPEDGQPLAVVLFDLDHFKRINDKYGHQTGDAVLKRVTELTRRQVRNGDIVGRIGGEEFVWLLPNVDAPRARDLAERLREVIDQESGQGGLPRVTISLGMALLRKGDTPEQLIARADEALYRAKESGRNCVQRAA